MDYQRLLYKRVILFEVSYKSISFKSLSFVKFENCLGGVIYVVII